MRQDAGSGAPIQPAVNLAAEQKAQMSQTAATSGPKYTGEPISVNLKDVDLKDFFPTLDYRRVKGLFESLGYAEAVAIPLALLATEPHVDEIMLDGRRHFVADGPRLLPQGAPTSPAITNLICRKLDRRLSGLAKNLGGLS